MQNSTYMKDLSIIIPSYNTRDITKQCINSLIPTLNNISSEIIVVDNASSDDSHDMLSALPIKPIFLSQNVGYSKANNRGLNFASGRYILYLNSDVLIDSVDFKKLIKYLDEKQDIGALTVKVNIPTGGIDPASHRGFPTLWRSFCYYAKLEKLFKNTPILNKIFGGYHLIHEDLTKEHEIDSPTGAFFLTRKSLMDELKGFDETFFMYGEDLDLAYRIKEKGFKIVYYPFYEVTHLKYKSGLSNKNTEVQKKIKFHFYEAMKIFYQKHYAKRHSGIVNKCVYFLIDLKHSLS